MADQVTPPVVTEVVPGPADTVALEPKFNVGDEVKLTVDGEEVNAVIRAVQPVGGSTAKYTVARAHDGVTGFKSEKYVDEARLSAPEVESAEEDAAEGEEEPKKAKKASKKAKKAEATPEAPAAPTAPEAPAEPTAPVTEPEAPAAPSEPATPEAPATAATTSTDTTSATETPAGN